MLILGNGCWRDTVRVLQGISGHNCYNFEQVNRSVMMLERNLVSMDKLRLAEAVKMGQRKTMADE